MSEKNILPYDKWVKIICRDHIEMARPLITVIKII